MKQISIVALFFSIFTSMADTDIRLPRDVNYAIKTVSQESTKLLAEDGAEGDLFGVSVSLYGNRALIGSYRDDDDGLSSGSAYIFEFDGLNWVFRAKLLAPDGTTGDVFGWSVSLDGDKALVGAFLDDDSAVDSGSAYIFEFDGNDWIFVQKITASDEETNDWFGSSVSISGDYALVGAEYGDGQVIDSGSAYVFYFDGINWTQSAKLFASDGETEDRFGSSVSIFDNRALIGSKYGTGQFSGSGSAYIFEYDENNRNWPQGAKLSASDGSIGDLFGHSVSISDDRALIGAHRSDDGFDSDTGSAYVFDYDGMFWNQSKKLQANDGNIADRFGYSVSLSGDFALIGAPYQDANGNDSGSAYLFQYDGTRWLQKSKLVQSDGKANNRFGYSVSQSDLGALIGVYRDDDNGTDSGSALVYRNALDLIYFGGFDSINPN